ncbi:MAG: type II CRISPR RNA-guided endonuclease Cas9 [Clostridia bacterium]|nr:type II CRISPR RNA-guided endonuclease Cas9 [Clostridia bacterium]
MGKSKFDENTEWYLGLDVGTNSVGWAATDTEYNVLKFNGNATWGIYLFDEAKTAAARRTNRTARRRLARKKQRIALLQGFFAREISKVDPLFYTRLKESALWSDDRSTAGDTSLFVGDNLTDKIYNRDYPTIHHLIVELIENPEYHDPRLVYMACSYILSHRGHFLIDVSENNIEKVIDFENIYIDFLSWFDSSEVGIPWCCSTDAFKNVLRMKTGVTAKEKSFYQDVMGGAKAKDVDNDENMPISIKNLISLICGRKIKVADLFLNDEYKDIDNSSITVSSATFDDEIDALSSIIDDAEYDLLLKVKKLYDWSVLVDILQGATMISKAKIKTYEQHEKDLKFLKYIVKTYVPDKYNAVFRDCGKEKNYASYSYNCKNYKGKAIPADYKMATVEEFSKYILGVINPLESEIDYDDAERFADMKERLATNSFCPKQMTGDNRVIPYQLYYVELKAILENASHYLDFLNESDSYGSNKDKILSIMKFRIPYYVGPLNNHSEHAWMVRKAAGPIYPWNFDEIVDKDASEVEFIRRMTGKCSYILGEDVLPKNSLLYAKFEVLNEINNIKVNDKKISVEAKQGIYENLFMRNRKVTVKKIKDYLCANGFMKIEDSLSGIDQTIKSSLKAYHDFKQYIVAGKLTECDVENIITRITLTTDRARLKKWLLTEYKLDEADAKTISKLKYSDFGRLSSRLLTEIYDIDEATGKNNREENIIQMMWSTNENFMMLMSSDYGYATNISKINQDYNVEHPRELDDKLKDMYISNAVKRPIIRTVEIVKELKSIFKSQPKKIFVEMARGATEDQKNKRTKSRRDQIKELYSNYDKNEVAELLKELDSKTDDELRSEKLFLYFSQLGKCMYSGQTINISEIGNQKVYDVDHIWPQSKIKDDSLDNKVLVLSTFNGKKGDTYPLDEEWRKKMYGYWKSLNDRKLISDKKFERLTRNTRFTDEELAQFINRQLVETRQSTKAIAEVLSDLMPNSKIVYVKAGLASNFRQEYKDTYYTLKCREVNDLHHAKDAYLNIVMGNIYDVKYTSNPLNFIKSGEIYSLNINPMLNHDVERNGVVAWRAKDDVWFDRVIKTLHKNNIRFVRYSYKQQGALFDLMPLRKGLGQVPRKKELDDIDKYGGYNKQTVAGFYLISYDDKKSRVTSLIDVPLRELSTINNLDDVIKYCEENSYSNPKILLNGRLIKPNSLWEIDGYRVHLSGKSGDSVWFKGGQQLIVSPEQEQYIKKIYKYCNRATGAKILPVVTEYDGLSVENNVNIYDLLLDKLTNTKFITFMSTAAETIVKNRDRFCSLSCEEQTIALSNIIQLFDCNNSQGKDLTSIGGVKSSGIQKMSMKLSSKRFKDIRIVDQSPTGLFESKTSNLLTL